MLIKGATSHRKAGSAPVYLNVYDISTANGCASLIGLGIYHSGVQVYDVEYAFGAHEAATSGIFECEPRQCPGFTFKKSILIGWTEMGPREVWGLMEDMGEDYIGITYNLITRNCNHFSRDACLRLTGIRIPSWVNRLARIGFMFNCMFPKNVHPEKVRHRSVDCALCEDEKMKMKIRNNSIACYPSSPSSKVEPTAQPTKKTTQRKCRGSSYSAPPVLETSAMLNI